MERGHLLELLQNGALLPHLEPVYGPDAAEAGRRLRELVLEYAGTFPSPDTADTWLFSTPGRAELGGSHTDHQHGRGLASAVNLDTIACVVPNDTGVIRVKSRGHRMASADLGNLSIQEAETGNSPALVRGVAARLRQLGYAIGGFDAYTTSIVPRGGGLSSSAAFEVLVATIMNHLFCGGSLSPLQTAQTALYAENVYFGKPSGLLDQLACATGGVIAADFQNPQEPQVRRLPLDLDALGYALCIMDTRASHASLIDDFSAIPREMADAAAYFGEKTLRTVSYERFLQELPQVRAACGDRAVLRAYHFFQEDRRVLRQCEALEQGDFETFLRCARASGRSSFMYLQNVSNHKDSRFQPLALLQALAEELLEDTGAVRVHGGGFAGTVEAFVPLERLDRFVQGMEDMAGRGSCHVIRLRSAGSVLLAH